MTLAEKLLASRQANIEMVIEQQAPKGWKAGRVTQDGKTTVTTAPVAALEDEPYHNELLEANGWDPAHYKIVGPIRQSTWTAYIPESQREEGGEYTFNAKAYRFNVVERAEGELSIDELIDVVNMRQFKNVPQKYVVGVGQVDYPTAAVIGAEAALEHGAYPQTILVGKASHLVFCHDMPYIVAVGDLQIGKYENPLEELLERFMALMEEAAAPLAESLAQGNKAQHVHLAFLGDCIEGMNSQGGRLRWRTRLTVTEQVKILRRLMLFSIELFAPLCDRLTVVSVPGNHDEANSRDMDTRSDDSWAIEALNMVADALEYNEERFGHVECYVPGPDEYAVVMDVGGTIVAHTHGHEHAHNKHFAYWAGQALGNQPMGQATIWLQGHGHHFQVDENGQRTWIEVPAVESISQWWVRKTGTGGNPGLITLQLIDGAVRNLNKLEPPKAS